MLKSINFIVIRISTSLKYVSNAFKSNFNSVIIKRCLQTEISMHHITVLHSQGDIFRLKFLAYLQKMTPRFHNHFADEL